MKCGFVAEVTARIIRRCAPFAETSWPSGMDAFGTTAGSDARAVQQHLRGRSSRWRRATLADV